MAMIIRGIVCVTPPHCWVFMQVQCSARDSRTTRPTLPHMYSTPSITPDYILVPETAKMYSQPSVAAFIEQEVKRPSKQWITSIISGDQEKDQVILRTDDFVLLPDTERVNRYWRTQSLEGAPASIQGYRNGRHLSNESPVPAAMVGPGRQTSRHTHPSKMTLNWLCIAHDLQIRTLRDLRGEHVAMLKQMLEMSMQAIQAHTGIAREQVMAYVHYPPSVYQLHVHFSYPYGQYCHRDAYRVHSLGTIISNLEIDPEFYSKATLYLAMYRHSLHYLALCENSTATDDTKDAKK